MKFRVSRTVGWIGALCALCLLAPVRLPAQAPAGPLPPSHPLPPPPKTPPAKRKPQIESRSSLAGFWKLNKEESDDPQNKIADSRHPSGGSPSGIPGSSPRGGIGYPYPGGGPTGPLGGGRGGDDTDERSLELEEYVRPAFTQTIDLKEGEVDTTNERDSKLVMFTDGRKLPKQKGNAPEAISAHWDGPKLVTEERGPQGRKVSRTYELSFDGKQIYETWRVEGRRSGNDIVIRYVYDAAIDEHK